MIGKVIFSIICIAAVLSTISLIVAFSISSYRTFTGEKETVITMIYDKYDQSGGYWFSHESYHISGLLSSCAEIEAKRWNITSNETALMSCFVANRCIKYRRKMDCLEYRRVYHVYYPTNITETIWIYVAEDQKMTMTKKCLATDRCDPYIANGTTIYPPAGLSWSLNDYHRFVTHDIGNVPFINASVAFFVLSISSIVIFAYVWIYMHGPTHGSDKYHDSMRHIFFDGIIHEKNMLRIVSLLIVAVIYVFITAATIISISVCTHRSFAGMREVHVKMIDERLTRSGEYRFSHYDYGDYNDVMICSDIKQIRWTNHSGSRPILVCFDTWGCDRADRGEYCWRRHILKKVYVPVNINEMTWSYVAAEQQKNYTKRCDASYPCYPVVANNTIIYPPNNIQWSIDDHHVYYVKDIGSVEAVIVTGVIFIVATTMIGILICSVTVTYIDSIKRNKYQSQIRSIFFEHVRRYVEEIIPATTMLTDPMMHNSGILNMMPGTRLAAAIINNAKTTMPSLIIIGIVSWSLGS